MLQGKTFGLVAVFALAVAATSASAQTAVPSRSGKPVQSDASAQKRTVMDENAAIAAASGAAVTGKFVANFTIKLTTPVPTGYTLQCNLTASVADVNKTTFTVDNEISEAAGTKATVSGSTATCTVSLPYSWNLADASTDTAELTYNLEFVNASTTTVATAFRFSTQFVPGAGAIKVPANGTTTTYTINATL